MSSVCRLIGAFVTVWALLASAPMAQSPLRVCADPNNMPFSNTRGDGFENRIATLVARELHVHSSTTGCRSAAASSAIRSMPDAATSSSGSRRNTDCCSRTRSYYRSAYVFVSRQDRHLRIDSFDAPLLKRLTIGIQMSGDDYNNPPAAQALATRQIVQNVRGFTMYGDYSRPDPQRPIIDAVAEGRVDIAVVWGPLAGYYAQRESIPIDVRPIAAAADGPTSRFTFDIAMGVRRDDMALRAALDGVITRRGDDMRRFCVIWSATPMILKRGVGDRLCVFSWPHAAVRRLTAGRRRRRRRS